MGWLDDIKDMGKKYLDATTLGAFGGGTSLGDATDKIFGKGAILGGIGYNSQGDTEKRDRETQAAIDALTGLQTPDYGTMAMKGPDAAADVSFNPAAQQYGQVTQAGPTAFNDISVDPQYKAEQLAQLEALKELRDNGGMNMQDRANLAMIQDEQNAQARGARDATMQRLQATGRGGSGMSLLAQLDADQNAQNQAHLGGLNVAAQAQNRALAAGNSAAGLAGGMQNQEFSQAAAKAQAADAIAKMNAQNLTGMSQWNAGQGNQMGQFNASGDFNAQTANQAKNQHVNDASANAYNQNAIYNTYTIPQAKYGAEANKAGNIANAYMGKAAQTQGDIAQQSQAQGNILSGITKLGSSYMSGSGKGGEEEAMAAAHGGKIPGSAPVRGDSPANDRINLLASPGEVVVPRSLVDAPNDKIGSFVHHAPPVGKQKEAMLAALANMRKQGR
jgi:hypothetical protein